MKTSDIFILITVVAALGFSIYKKYLKNKQGNQIPAGQEKSSFFSSGSSDDDYEPYKKK
jgi:hypothetical protein